jgi:hypothetical protein
MAYNNVDQKSFTGTSWIRAEQVILDNPYQASPRISYIEKEMTVLDNGKTFNEPFNGGLSREYVLGEDFPLISPIDGSVVPKDALPSMASADMIQLLIYSDYLNQVSIRDAANANKSANGSE